MEQPRITIVCGHYGSGKTNLSVNLALEQTSLWPRRAVADLDLVNPYFRTADFAALLAERGVELIAPLYANSNLDLPILPPRIAAAILQQDLRLIIDVGGDDDGAVALGGLSARLTAQGYQMLYVINRSRYLKDDPDEELRLLESIQRCSRLGVTALVNNTNLGPETTPALVKASAAYLEEISCRTGLPVAFTTAEESLCPGLAATPNLRPISIFVKTPWEGLKGGNTNEQSNH